MPTRIVFGSDEYVVVSETSDEVARILSRLGGDLGSLACMSRPGEGAPEVMINPANVLYVEPISDAAPFVDHLG